MTVKLGHDIWDMTSAMTLDRITQTGQSGQVLTGQPGQDREYKMPGYDKKNWTCGQVSFEQERWSRTAGTGQDR
jgi:hypothetical protein